MESVTCIFDKEPDLIRFLIHISKKLYRLKIDNEIKIRFDYSGPVFSLKVKDSLIDCVLINDKKDEIKISWNYMLFTDKIKSDGVLSLLNKIENVQELIDFIMGNLKMYKRYGISYKNKITNKPLQSCGWFYAEPKSLSREVEKHIDEISGYAIKKNIFTKLKKWMIEAYVCELSEDENMEIGGEIYKNFKSDTPNIGLVGRSSKTMVFVCDEKGCECVKK